MTWLCPDARACWALRSLSARRVIGLGLGGVLVPANLVDLAVPGRPRLLIDLPTLLRFDRTGPWRGLWACPPIPVGTDCASADRGKRGRLHPLIHGVPRQPSPGGEPGQPRATTHPRTPLG